MSITKSQAKFLASGILNRLGSANVPSNDGDLPILEEMLKVYGAEFIKEAQHNIDKDKLVGSGNLRDIQMEFTKFGTTYSISLGYPKSNPASKYYDFVNKGVKGTKNKRAKGNTPYKFNPAKFSLPFSVMEDWLKYNKLKTLSVKKYTKTGVETKLVSDKKELARYLAIGIHRKGIKTSGFFDKSIKSVFNKEFSEAISEAIGQDFSLKIRQINKEIKNDNNRK